MTFSELVNLILGVYLNFFPPYEKGLDWINIAPIMTPILLFAGVSVPAFFACLASFLKPLASYLRNQTSESLFEIIWGGISISLTIIFVSVPIMTALAWSGWSKGEFFWSEMLVTIFGLFFRFVDGFFMFLSGGALNQRGQDFVAKHSLIMGGVLVLFCGITFGVDFMAFDLKLPFKLVWILLTIYSFYNLLTFIVCVGDEDYSGQLYLFYLVSLLTVFSLLVDMDKLSAISILVLMLSYPLGIFVGIVVKIRSNYH